MTIDTRLRTLKRRLDVEPDNPHAILGFYSEAFRSARWERRRFHIATTIGDKRRVAPCWVVSNTLLFSVHKKQWSNRLWAVTHIPSGAAFLQDATSEEMALHILYRIVRESPIDWLRLTYDNRSEHSYSREAFNHIAAITAEEKARRG